MLFYIVFWAECAKGLYKRGEYLSKKGGPTVPYIRWGCFNFNIKNFYIKGGYFMGRKKPSKSLI